MEQSKHNIITAVHGSDDYIIVNLLSGQADILEPPIGRALLRGEVPSDPEYVQKGYVVDPEAEKRLFVEKFEQFKARRRNDEVQLFFVPWYTCNFACSYCFQDEYHNAPKPLTRETVDGFFAYVGARLADRNAYVTLFGGEPLLPGKRTRDIVSYFLTQAWNRDLPVAVVTNGYTLSDYVELLSQGPIREIQVTLDGPRDIHDSRRPRKGATDTKTFDRIVEGIDAALASELRINLRVVVDRENLASLPALARFAKDKGWTDTPLFKTQIGRNYELHHCAAQPGKLYSRIDLYRELHDLIGTNPEVLDFHKPAFSVMRFLSENGELPDALFDACPGCTTEWAFDYTGSIYSCTATVGKTDERLGTFYPEIRLDSQTVNSWQKRNVTTVKACSSCPVRLACGGGCASVAKNTYGTISAPDCRPVEGLVGLGTSCYFQKEAHHG